MSSKLLKRILKRIKQRLRTFYFLNFRKFIRISSSPFISGDTFRKHADHVMDEVSTFKVENLKDYDKIFIKSDYLEKFVQSKLKNIKKKVIVLLHNSDLSFEENDAKNFLGKEILVFSQNLNLDFTKYKNIFPLPIGIENRSYFMNGKLRNFKRVMNKQVPKSSNNLVLCAFNPTTNPERNVILELSSKNKFINFLRFSSHQKYLNEVSKHKFNLCPEGNGIDTHRFWESLMVGTIPIVKNNNLIKNFESIGIPCLVLSDWSELGKLNEEVLNNYFDSNIKNLNENKACYFSFWKDFIENKTKNYFS